MKKQKDYTILLLGLIASAVVLPLLCAAPVLETEQPAIVRYVDMSQAEKLTVNVDLLAVTERGLEFAGNLVEVDPGVDQEELIYCKEEIVLRILGPRVSIIAGDNGEF